jgi:uncharacterized coiled-coil protein SlyX
LSRLDELEETALLQAKLIYKLTASLREAHQNTFNILDHLQKHETSIEQLKNRIEVLEEVYEKTV